MIQYYGYELSPNQIETGEGFLICRNVPIARIGDQDYLGSEIGLDGDEAGKIIPVHRNPEEVFSDATIASFEGKPVTNDHPPGIIGPDDVTLYEKGHAQNVRKGSGEWSDYIIADLHIHDRELINAIQNGKREVSCGYECDYIKDADGAYSQHNIRGNHIAVVDQGRAGKRAAILDSKIEQTAENPPERKGTMKSKILELFGLAAKDKSPEEIARMAQDAAATLDEAAPPAKGNEPVKSEKDAAEKPAEDEDYKKKLFESIDDEALDGLLEKLMARKAAKEAAEKEADGDPIEKTIAALTGEAAGETEADKEEAHVVPAEEMDKKSGDCGMMDKALAAMILKSMKPVVSAIKNEKERTAVADALIKCVTVNDGASDIAKIMQAAQSNARKAADSKPSQQKMLDDVQAAYDALNPHKAKKEGK